jgi:hypothetical protein
VGPPVETLDLSGILPLPGPHRTFERKFRKGRERGIIWVLSLKNFWQIDVSYSRPGKGRSFSQLYRFEAVPARLTRGLVRLGASDAFLLRLQAAYEDILRAVRPVEPEEVHTDTGAYDE